MLLLYSRRVLFQEQLQEATVYIQDEKIVDVQLGRHENALADFVDHGNDVIMPGLMDSHVHINEPGRTAWEGFETATRAAAAGGLTTLIDMPLNSSPVTTTARSLQLKRKAAEHKCLINCGFWGGVVPDNTDKIEELLQAGVFGIKAFLTHSGIDDFPNVEESDLIKILPTLQKYNAPLLVHCELSKAHAAEKELKDNPRSYSAYLASRPRSWEDEAIAMMIRLCETYNARTHIVHLSSSNSITQIREAKRRGLPITVETCPHYLCFNSEDIDDGQTYLKCAPPIREKENNDQLWTAIKDGVIDFIVTDHSPAPPEIKHVDTGDFEKAWGGIASLQLSLPAFWSAARQREFSVVDVAKLMSSRIANFLSIADKKGKICKGYDADIVVWNPEHQFKVNADEILHRHKLCPYNDLELYGLVRKTICGGRIVYENGLTSNVENGRILMNFS